MTTSKLKVPTKQSSLEVITKFQRQGQQYNLKLSPPLKNNNVYFMSENLIKKRPNLRSRSTPRRPSKNHESARGPRPTRKQKADKSSKKQSLLAEKGSTKNEVIDCDLEDLANHLQTEQHEPYQTRTSLRKKQKKEPIFLPRSETVCEPCPEVFPEYNDCINSSNTRSSEDKRIQCKLKELWSQRKMSELEIELNYFAESDLYTLKNNCPLNDNVVNEYISILRKVKTHENIKVMNTFFLQKIKEYLDEDNTQKIDRILRKQSVNESSTLLVPVHWKQKVHWSFLKLEKGLITILDSIPNRGKISKLLVKFYDYLFKVEFAIKVDKNFPRQDEGTLDCGIFMLNGMRAIVLGQSFEKVFEQGIQKSRIRIANQICQKTIITE